MAITPNVSSLSTLSTPQPTPSYYHNNNSFNSFVPQKDHLLKGEALIASLSISDFEMINMRALLTEDNFLMDAKQKLMSLLVQKMFENNNIEFTKLEKPEGGIIFHARIYVLPNSDVTLLRTNGIIK